MKSLTDQLSSYASYHRDTRNVLTHLVGIPMIVVAIATLMARWSFGMVEMGNGWVLDVNLAVLASVLTCVYYLKLDVRYGAVMSALFALACWVGTGLAQHDQGAWLTWGLGLFAVGWVFQFVGHWFEGRKPAFVDDLIGLIIGPLFVVAEVGFFLRMRPQVHAAVVRRSGPLR
jgi:uncharacterized membrane protein YGL010W